MKPEIAFGLVLKSIREEKGGSQEILTLDADLDRTFISLLERGRRQPSLSSILALARSLGGSAGRVGAANGGENVGVEED